jgi:predicted metalloendopeptidase
MHKATLLACATALACSATSPAGLDPANFDASVMAQDDFFLHANGGWLKTATIPPEQATWGAFMELRKRNLEILRGLCEQAADKGVLAPPVERMVGDFYASGMDEAAINAAGAAPLQAEFEAIAAIQTPADLLIGMARLHGLGVAAGFGFGSGPDATDCTTVVAELGQGGICLPGGRGTDRDYYLNPDAKYATIREQYLAHVAKMLELAGDPPDLAVAGAQAVMRIETALAKGWLSRVENRNPQLGFHKVKVADLPATTGDLDWPGYFRARGAPDFSEFNLAHPEFFKVLAAALKSESVADWKAYLRWQLVHAVAPLLSEAFVAENFRFFAATLSGVKEQMPRWERVVTLTDGSLPEALGPLYVAQHFPPQAKAQVLQLVADLRDAFRARIQQLEWMDEATRAKALAKLEAFDVKMGYPDKWRDYSSVTIDRGPLVLNVLRLRAFEIRRELAKIGKPVDKSEWHMSAATVNAYYSPQSNGITFPAGILQAPFFDPQADAALNYGGIGTVIGHEMTHGFDDSGRQFDAQGNLQDWWTAECTARFKERAAAVVKQFAAYTSADAPVNGELTLGENIADLGGLKIAHAALLTALAGKARDKIDGLTPEQRFFLSYANLWRGVVRPEEQRKRLNTDPHSPPEWRVRGPLSNLDEFARAFEVPEGAPMRRAAAERVAIW